jgi:hypothetical protein
VISRHLYLLIGVLSIAGLVTTASAQRERSTLMPTDQRGPWPDAFDADIWTPSVQQILEMEKSFDALKVLKPKGHVKKSFVFEPEDYYMQYVGAQVWGSRCIHINAFRIQDKKIGRSFGASNSSGLQKVEVPTIGMLTIIMKPTLFQS